MYLTIRGVCVIALLFSFGQALAAQIKISGSDTMESLAQNALSQYARGQGKGVVVTTDFRGTSQGFKDLCEGRVAMALASTIIDSETAARCQKAGVAYVELPIAFDAIAVIAHPSRVLISELSLAELKLIFSPESVGKVTRWSQVRATLPDAPLTVISLDPKSGTNAFFGNVVHGMRGFVRPDAKTDRDHLEVAKMVANDPSAIGFVSLGVLSDSRIAVWKVPVNFGRGAISPTREAVLNESYSKLARVLYIYVSKSAIKEKNGHVLDLAMWIMERAGKLAAYEGFIPLIDTNYSDGMRALREAAPR
ncbi:MAG: PstS family phosphate ABC transporter substrate-binding protein [Burkholderiales bacterium]